MPTASVGHQKENSLYTHCFIVTGLRYTATVMKRRILLAMITVGNGHKAPADAIKAGIEKLYPEQFVPEVLDFTAAVGDVAFDKRHKGSWNWMLEYPQVAYWGQVLLDSLVPVEAIRFGQGVMLAQHAENAARFLQQNQYDLIVATHFFTVQAIAIAKQKHGIKTPLVAINADPFDAHAMWAEPRVDEMIVASEIAQKRLLHKKMPASKITVMGFPLGLPFLEYHASPTQARLELGLAPDLPTVVQSAGGEGIGGNLEQFVAAVFEADLPVQYVVICGRNQALVSRLEALKARYANAKTKLVVNGFVSDMYRWLAAADLVLGKAGASTTMEALAMKRPIFHTSYVAYNEKANLDWCLLHGVGRYVPKPEELVGLLRGYLEQPQTLAALQQKVRELGVSGGTLEVAQHLVRRYLEA
jgi:processive 1,2-diacylglycerol beta-glucosyltransferase